jgi:hypothetical protein
MMPNGADLFIILFLVVVILFAGDVPRWGEKLGKKWRRKKPN